jgi:hypothetical protein
MEGAHIESEPVGGVSLPGVSVVDHLHFEVETGEAA